MEIIEHLLTGSYVVDAAAGCVLVCVLLSLLLALLGAPVGAGAGDLQVTDVGRYRLYGASCSW